MNVFSFTGNLGKDCRKGTGSTAVLNFGVGVRSGYGEKEQTIWIDCALWGKQAESRLSEYLLKGQQVAVSGELGTREHEGKIYLTCRVNSIDLVGGKRDDSAMQSPQAAKPAAPAADIDDDPIPF
jgi:single-strand DNA-binding protein